MITKKRVTSIILALTVAVTSMFAVGMPAEAEAKTKGSKIKVNMEAPKKIGAKLSTLEGGYDDVVVTWSNVKKAKGYYVYYKRTNLKSDSWHYAGKTSRTYLKKKNLRDGKSYKFLVKPYKQKGNTIYKSKKYRIVKITTLKKMVTPTVKRYSSGKVKVSWKDIYGQDGYQISRSTSKKGTNVVYTYKTRSGKSKVIKATKNKRYYYKVRAYKNVKTNGKIKRVYAPWSSVRSYKVSVKPSRPHKPSKPSKPQSCGSRHDGYKPAYGGWTKSYAQLENWAWEYIEKTHGKYAAWGVHECGRCGAMCINLFY